MLVRFEYTNIGQSPAKQTRAGVAWRYSDSVSQADFPRFIMRDFVWRLAGDVKGLGGPAEFLSKVDPPASAESFVAAVNQGKFIYFAAHIFYKDVFGHTRTEKYRLYTALAGRDWTHPQKLEVMPTFEGSDDDDDTKGTPIE